jgi:hypothetical protein
MRRTTKMAVRKFQRNLGGNNSTYKCECCGKRTRETGLGESGLGLCAYCYDEGGLENSLQDGHIGIGQYNIDIFNLRKQYDRCFVCGDADPFHATRAHTSAERDAAIFTGTSGHAPIVEVEQRSAFAVPQAADFVAEPTGHTVVLGLERLNDDQRAAVIAMVKAMGGEVLND